MTKRNHGTKPLSRAAFEREPTRVVDGGPDADPDVRAFFDGMRREMGIAAALPHRDGIEVLRKGGDR